MPQRGTGVGQMGGGLARNLIRAKKSVLVLDCNHPIRVCSKKVQAIKQ
jgi:3-hydroxyisobutyrate dehydrogenase-like beta-hydroxyacid dehydrogenase